MNELKKHDYAKSVEYSFGVYIVMLIRSVLKKENPPKPYDGFDWQSFKSFTDMHSLSNTVAYAVCALDGVPESVKESYSEVILFSAAKEAQYEVEISELIDDFEKNSIPHMLLKGYVVKNLYPYTNMRSMCDVDILVGSDVDSAGEIMSSHGFEKKSSENLHDSFFKKPSTIVELHKSLFDEELTKLNDYFKVGFERAKTADGFKYRYELSDEDFYIFLISHFYKHFARCGTGIRSVLDIYLFLSKYSDKLDFEYVNSELKKIGLDSFNKKISSLAFKWFGSDGAIKPDTIGEYIFSSGTYGKTVNLELNRFLNNSDEGSYSASKIKYVIKTLFPSRAYMSARYPVLNKCPFLLPLYWLIRGVSTLINRRKNIKYRLKGVVESDPSTADRFKDSGLS